MAREYRQNTPYESITDEDEQEENKAHGNTGLPFGLCKKFGISLPDNATPRDAWEALKRKTGLTPEQVYRDLKKKENAKRDEAEKIYNSEASTDISPEIVNKSAKEKMLNDSRCVFNKRFTKQFMDENLEAGNVEACNLTVTLFNNDSFGYNANERDTAFYPGFNKVCIREKDSGGEENDSYYSKGGVFYHETWHAIDSNYGEGDNRDALSNTYRGVSGKTLQEALIEETRAVDWNGVKAAIERDIDEYYSGQGINRKQIMQKRAEAAQKAKDIFDKTLKDTNSYFEAMNARSAYLYSQEYINIMAEYEKVKAIPKSTYRKWGDLSDVYSGFTSGRRDLVAMKHSRSYWQSDINKRGKEAFAECASAKATSPESYEVLKTYIPNTVAVFEEIYSKLLKGEIKAKGRAKYEP